MKKMITLLLLFTITVSLVACAPTASESTNGKGTITSVDDVNWEDYCSGHAKTRALYYHELKYEVEIRYSGISINTVKETGDGVYVCYGTVSGKDYYGNRCSANFSVTCEVDMDKATDIINNGGVSNNPEDSDPFHNCVDDIETDFGALIKG